MAKADQRFKSIPGGKAESAHNSVDIWVCRVCEIDAGIATSAITQIRIAPKIVRGHVVNGTRAWACAMCLGRGKITRVT